MKANQAAGFSEGEKRDGASMEGMRLSSPVVTRPAMISPMAGANLKP